MKIHSDSAYVFAAMDPTLVLEADEGLFVTGYVGPAPELTVMLDTELLDALKREMKARKAPEGIALILPLDKVVTALVGRSTCVTGEIDDADAQAWSALFRAYADQIDAMPRISAAYPEPRAAIIV